MYSSLASYALAFIEGLALIVSPCILPILPIMLSGSIEGGRRRPLGIICGFVITFALFTFFSRAIIQNSGINLDILRYTAFAFIALFGVILLSSRLSEKFSQLTQSAANLGATLSTAQNTGFKSGLILGALVSLIWVPCGGPILAAAIVQTAVQASTLQSFLSFFFFALGSVIPMIIIALLGKKVIDKLGFLKTKTELLRKIFGVIIIIGAALAAFSPASLYTTMPNPNAKPEIISPVQSNTQLINGLNQPYPAPSILGAGPWINSPPLNLQALRGKVVLIDFWTYSCINCVRTLPYIKDWYAKYHQNGLVIIGVHAPEFAFEKNFNNVQIAVKKYGITYPVVMDNNYVIWRNYNNQYWPADYLIDKNGNVVYQHFGEGDYDEGENNIRVLLGLNKQINSSLTNTSSNYAQTPETYLGYARANSMANSRLFRQNRTLNYKLPTSISMNQWALQGAWNSQAQYIENTSAGAAISIHFSAQHVYAVMGSSNGQTIPVKVLLNGQPIGNQGGKDVNDSIVNLSSQTLYELVSLPQAGSGVLTLVPQAPGAQFYTFTFG